MGLFDGKILKLGEHLSEALRMKAAGYHEEASNLIASGRNAMGMKALVKGEILEDVAEIIEKVTGGD